MQNQFEESGLLFSFNERWRVKKYDQTRFYRYISGNGMRGVDFIGILDDRQVVFIEVKNFGYQNEKQSPEQRIVPIEDLKQKMNEKIADTLAGIRIVHRYMKRKWRFRLLFWLRKNVSEDLFRASDWLFWVRLHELSQQGTPTSVLWLEEDSLLKDPSVVRNLSSTGFTVHHLKLPAFAESLTVQLSL